MTSRKFLLYNSEDDLVDLNNHEIFALNPTGLGVSFSNSFSNVSANFLQEKSVLNSASLKLDIIFSRNSTTPYEKYEEFVKFDGIKATTESDIKNDAIKKFIIFL